MPKTSAAQKAAAPRVLRGTVYITRQVHFNSAHRLHNPAKSQQWNE
jgi:6-pyruvoyltetrahydropterin/6-carboxytetrahydropterin synthase